MKLRAIARKRPGKYQALYCTRFHTFVHGFLLPDCLRANMDSDQALTMRPEAFAYLGKGDKV